MVMVYMSRINRTLLFLICPLLLFVAAGCQLVVNPVIRPIPHMVWPVPPEIPRIQFINSVSGPLDLGIRKNLFEKFYAYMTGEEDVVILAPYGLEMDRKGKLYVVDTFPGFVHVLNQFGNRHYRIPKSGKRLESPIDVAVDSNTGIVYVTDSKAKVVKIYGDFGRRYVGELGRGILERPTGIAINKKTSELLVVDTLSSNIVRYSLNDHHLKGFFGTHGKEDGEFHYPTHIFTASDGKIIVSDSLNFRVQIFSSDGLFVSKFGKRGNRPGQFSRPKGVASDSAGNIYVVDTLFDIVQIFDKMGRLLLDFGGPGHEVGKFWLPTGIYIDDKDYIYISDSYNKRVQIFRYLKGKEALQ